MIELKNCPFCGSEDVILDKDVRRIDRGLNGHFVECQDCFGSSGYYKSESCAIEAWNRRICPQCSDDEVKQPCIEGPCKSEPRQLTMDELRQMDGLPVWIEPVDADHTGMWGVVSHHSMGAITSCGVMPHYVYGEKWIAFDRPLGGDAK